MGFRQNFPTFFLSILLMLVSASAVLGQDMESRIGTGAEDALLVEARDLSERGKLQEAADAYTRWLAENSGHPDFGLILIEAADSQVSVERALELLRIYTPRVQDPGQRELCRSSQIDLLEMLGRTEQALGLLRSFPTTPRWLYRQAQLLYQEGLVQESEKSLQQALKALLSDDKGDIDKDPENSEQEARIRLLQARIFIVQNRGREAENLFGLLSAKYGDTALGPGILLAHYEYLLAQGRKEAAEKQLQALARKFPDSPELALARAEEGRTDEGEQRIGYAPIPSRLLPADLAVPRPDSGLETDQESPISRSPTVEPEQSPELEPPETIAPSEPPPTVQTGAAARPAAAAQTQATAEDQPEVRTPTPAQPRTVAQPENKAQSPVEVQPSSPTALVQTGSFRDRENAQYMVRDLKVSGFEAGIVEKRIGTTLYYRVVIGPLMTVEQAQAVLMQLKDASFEGVLLFPE